MVIADIGTNSGEYVSFIISDNEKGAYGIGQVLAKAMTAKGWNHGTVGLVTISLARLNGKARTKGFMQAMDEAGIKQGGAVADADLHRRRDLQVRAGHADRASRHARPVHRDRPADDRRAARAEGGASRGDVLVAAFDGIPEFIDLIESGQIVGSGMQQPYLMGQSAAQAMFDHFAGKTPEKQILVPILVVDQQNVKQVAPTVRKTVFGL